MDKMRGMVAIVTGSSRGLGRAIALEYGREGAMVVACARPASPTQLPGTVAETAQAILDQGGESLPIACDVSDEAQVKSMVQQVVDRYGKVDVLVNNAGMLGKVSFQEGASDQMFGAMDYGAWADVFRVNSMSPMKMAEAFIGQIMAGDRKTIVTLSSGMGSNSDKTGGVYAYRTSKAAVTRLMTTLAVDLEDKGITSVALHPGWVRTDMGTDGADISVEESTDGLFKVISGLGLVDSGRFINYAGEDMPW